MKKFTAIILAFVLMFSLSVTAFAAGEAVGEDSADGETTVSLIIDGTQISATVPLTVTLAVNSSGVVTGPTGYTIKNTSVMPVKVTSVAITPKSGFALTGSDTKTGIGDITLTNGREGATVKLSEWAESKTTTSWNLSASGSATANITLAFSGTVTGIVQDITTATAAFTVTFTISAGAHTNP